MAGASLLLFGNIRKNRFLSPKRKKSFIGEGTYLDATATISPKGVNIGKNCVIKEHAVIYTNTEIGDNVTIMPGAVIGGQGFVYIKIR